MQIALQLVKPIPKAWSSSFKMQMPVKKRIKSFTHFKTSLRILLLFTQSCPTLWLHGLQPARLPSPSPSPRVCWNSCPLSQGCHPTVSSSVVPFSSYLQSFPASGSFPMSQFFASGGQSIRSFSFSIIPSDEYSVLISFRIDWFDLLAVQETLKSLLQHIFF